MRGLGWYEKECHGVFESKGERSFVGFCRNFQAPLVIHQYAFRSQQTITNMTSGRSLYESAWGFFAG